MGFEVYVLWIIVLFQKISVPLPWKLSWFKPAPSHPTLLHHSGNSSITDTLLVQLALRWPNTVLARAFADAN